METAVVGNVLSEFETFILFSFFGQKLKYKKGVYKLNCKNRSVKCKKSSNLFKKISGKFKHKRIRLLYFLFTIYPHLPRVLYLISPSSTLHLSSIFLSQEDALLRNKIVTSFSCKFTIRFISCTTLLYYSTSLRCNTHIDTVFQGQRGEIHTPYVVSQFYK